jgi:hypothetical protein
MPSRRRQRPESSAPLAGFQPSTPGRISPSTEALDPWRGTADIRPAAKSVLASTSGSPPPGPAWRPRGARGAARSGSRLARRRRSELTERQAGRSGRSRRRERCPVHRGEDSGTAPGVIEPQRLNQPLCLTRRRVGPQGQTAVSAGRTGQSSHTEVPRPAAESPSATRAGPKTEPGRSRGARDCPDDGEGSKFTGGLPAEDHLPQAEDHGQGDDTAEHVDVTPAPSRSVVVPSARVAALARNFRSGQFVHLPALVLQGAAPQVLYRVSPVMTTQGILVSRHASSDLGPKLHNERRVAAGHKDGSNDRCTERTSDAPTVVRPRSPSGRHAVGYGLAQEEASEGEPDDQEECAGPMHAHSQPQQ